GAVWRPPHPRILLKRPQQKPTLSGLRHSRVTREHILAEIRRLADANGGIPVGKVRFFQETGLREHDFVGRWWASWGEAVREAGFEPQQLMGRISDDEVLQAALKLIRSHGRVPTGAEIKIAARADSSLP